MTKILCIETSSVNCSVAVFEGNRLLASVEYGEAYVHSEKLHLFIKESLEQAKLKLTNLDAVAVGSGPGSFTGLRIGAATAKGLCYSLNIPLIEVSTMATMVRRAINHSGVVKGSYYSPVIDARRMDLYVSIYDSDVHSIRGPEALTVTRESFEEELKVNKMIFLGDGIEKLRELYGSDPNARFLGGIVPGADQMNAEAMDRYNLGNFEDFSNYEPLYLRDFQPTTPRDRL